MFDFLNDNLLIICPNSYKLAILKYLEDSKKIFNIKFMSKNEYLKCTKFDYNQDTIHYLVKNKKMKVDNAITLLNNLYYVEDKKYDNEKLDYLTSVKKELDDNNLLIYDYLFNKILKRRKVVIYGYGKLNSFDRKMFSDALVIPYDSKEKKYDIYKFNDISLEVEFVFQKICDLLSDGVDINNISLMNIDSEYIPYLSRMEKFYGIKIEYNNNNTLMGTIIGNKLIDLINDNKTIDEIISTLKTYEEDSEYNSVVSILNKYSDYNLKDYIDEIKYDLLNKKIKKDKLLNVVKIKNIFDYVNSDEYVFLMNFNSPSIPRLRQDIDYITDDISDLVGLDKIEEENELIKANTVNYLSNINNIIISYKEESPFNKYNPSILLDYINYEIKEYDISLNYSDIANKSLYTMYLDDLVKYGIKNKNVDLLYTNYDKNDYLSYDNKFTGINKDKLTEYLNNELALSYSSIDNYYKCAFKYYLSNILKIDEFSETFYTIIGSLFHYVLSKMNEDNFDMDKEYNYFLKDKEFTNKEKFFLDKLKNDLKFIIDTIRKHQFISGFTNMLYEHKIDIKLMNSPYVHFKGFVDKIMYQEKDNETLVSIIDYKTGNTDIKIKNLKFGLSMQLPIYLYLVNNSDVLKNIKFTGFYLQHILDVNLKKGNKKTREEENYDNLKLLGYSTSDLNRLSIFDSTYENSEMIHGMKLTKDGEISRVSNVLSDDDIDKILELTHEKIINAMNNILEAKFDINPKILNNHNMSCEYCTFKDICYHTEKDNVYLETGGEDDAYVD